MIDLLNLNSEISQK